MAKFTKKKSGDLPAMNTASLPDIVFMLLFFFMVVTVMRKNTLLVAQKLPFADQTEKLQNKNLVMYIYAGKPSLRYQSQFGTESRIQLNDKFAKIGDIQTFVLHEKQSKNPGVRNQMITSLKVDQNTNMGLVSDVKHELREAKAYRINYTTRSGNAEKNIGR